MPNPVLTPQRWNPAPPDGAGETGWAAPSGRSATSYDVGVARPVGQQSPIVGKKMTIGGTFSATLVLFMLILITAAWGWSQVSQTTVVVGELIPGQEPQTQVVTNYPGWVFLPMLAGLGIAFLTVFKPTWARVTGPLYALGMGFALGAISHMYNLQSDGIVLQAVGATAAVFAVMLFLYATRIVKVTPKFVRTILGAMGGILVLYLTTWILTLFGVNVTFWNEPSPLGIGISIVIVIVASLNLALDFNFIEQSVKAGAPKSMEWFGAFGLTVSLVWLYLEILRLLSLLRQ